MTSSSTTYSETLAVDFHPSRWKRFIRKLIWFFSIYLPPRRVVAVVTRNGLLSFDSRDKTTGRLLWVYRQHEFDEIESVCAYLHRAGLRRPERDHLLDVGAYIGMTSIAFLREAHFNRSICFEPSPSNFSLLQRNIEQNQLEDRVTAINIALGQENGEILFELSEKNHGDNRVRTNHEAANVQENAYNEQCREVIKVPMRTLDSLGVSGLLDPGKIGLLWMDVQGAEPAFFSGATHFFYENSYVPVYFEFWPYGMRRAAVDTEEMFSLLERSFEGFVNWSDGTGVCRPPSELRALYAELQGESSAKGEPGTGANILLIPRRQK